MPIIPINSGCREGWDCCPTERIASIDSSWRLPNFPKQMRDKVTLTPLPRQLKLRPGQRKALPATLKQRESYSVWEIIKPNIGKDFSRFAVPVFLNEPLCFLQRLAEYMQYTDLLELAATQDDPVDRMAYVGAFAVSALSANWNRLSKPFNPMLLETFEWEKDGVRFLAEQVSHHPPVAAIHAEGPNFIMKANIQPKMSIGLNKLVCTPDAKFEITLTNRNEVYTYGGPTCCIYNVMMGKMYMNLTGNMSVQCASTGYSMNLSMDAGRGWHIKSSDVHIDGYIEKDNSKVRAIYGNWAYFLATCSVETFKDHHSAYVKAFMNSLTPGNEEKAPILNDSAVLWVANKLVNNYEKQFFFSYFTLTLNEIDDELSKKLPPTDSRLRPDLAALENGKLDEAETVKHKLEEGQRNRRKLGVGGTPLWFRGDNSSGWNFTGEYWKRDWSNSTDIFLLKSEDSKSKESQSGSISKSPGKAP